ncbi:MAG: hypothetical protein ACO4CT_04780 [Planctomycetota bacterium]|jgi:hypothetical protein
MNTDPMLQRLDAIDRRLERIEALLSEVETLRSALQHERDSRAALADQTAWLIESLGETRLELRRERESSKPN